MSKTLLAINTLTSVGSQPYASHLNLAFRMGKESDDEFILFNGWRSSIDRFRNEAAKIALHQDCDYLMFLDDDVLVPRDCYTILKKHDVDIVTPVVYIRSYPFHPMFFKSVQGPNGAGLTFYDDWEEVIAERLDLFQGLLPVAAIGFSCCLIKVSLLQRIQPAWFVTGTNHTEDVYFCVKAKQTLGDVGIYVDTSVDAGHMLDPEFVSRKNRAALMQFYEALNPHLLKATNQQGDHDKEYLERNQAALDKAEELAL